MDKLRSLIRPHLKVAVDSKDLSTIQAGLGTAYAHRQKGERSDNLERAVKAYEVALAGPIGKTIDTLWAALQYNLAAAYEQRIQGQRHDNLIRAAAAYGAALLVWTTEVPEDHERVELYKNKVLADLSVSTPPSAPQ